MSAQLLKWSVSVAEVSEAGGYSPLLFQASSENLSRFLNAVSSLILICSNVMRKVVLGLQVTVVLPQLRVQIYPDSQN